MTSPTMPLLLRAQRITNWYARELAQVAGISKPLAHAILQGRTPEYLDAGQRRRVVEAVREHLRVCNEEFEEMELLF